MWLRTDVWPNGSDAWESEKQNVERIPYWTRQHIDFAGLLDGYYYLGVVDSFTKLAEKC